MLPTYMIILGMDGGGWPRAVYAVIVIKGSRSPCHVWSALCVRLWYIECSLPPHVFPQSVVHLTIYLLDSLHSPPLP